jgi:hypothetical protein
VFTVNLDDGKLWSCLSLEAHAPPELGRVRPCLFRQDLTTAQVNLTGGMAPWAKPGGEGLSMVPLLGKYNVDVVILGAIWTVVMYNYR